MPDATPEELAFRVVEKQLDNLLAAARSALAADGIEITDESKRQYWKGEPRLWWGVRLKRDWFASYERARVSVVLGYLEPLSATEPPTVQVARWSEVFDEGRPSRVLLTTARSLALPELASTGLSRLWKEEIAAGVQEIENALASERQQM